MTQPQIEFVKSQEGFWIPIIDGALLHSTVDPIKEASRFIEGEWERIKNVKSIIVFGLGGGFHILEILKRQKIHIVVIENHQAVAQNTIEKLGDQLRGAEIIAGVPPAQVYRESEITKALSHSYCIIRHPVCVRTASYYYTAVAQLLNQRTLLNLRELSKGNPRLHQFLESLNISSDQILTLPMVEEAMARRESFIEREGLIWMTLRELVI